MPSETLTEARYRLSQAIEAGGMDCPCCNRWAKVNSRYLNSAMARAMIWIVKTYLRDYERGWIDVPNSAPQWLVKTNQLASCRWWGLVERRPTDDKAKKHSGLWKPTNDGQLFVMGRKMVPAKLWVSNAVVGKTSDDLTSIHGCLGTHFDYDEMMGDTLG